MEKNGGCILPDSAKSSATLAIDASPDIFRVVLIGAMGCGKSTFTKAVCGNDTAIAGVDEEGNGVTREVHAYFMKESICYRLGVSRACVLDVPGTGDPSLPLQTLLPTLEHALSTFDVHAIVLMNVASESRVNIGVRVATTLLEKSFISSTDQIVGCMTQADCVPPRKAKTNKKIWSNVLQKEFGVEIPVVLCALPVMDEEPFDVLEPEQFEEWDIDWDPEGPSIDAVLDELKRLAKDPKIAKYTDAGGDIVLGAAMAMGVDVKEMHVKMDEVRMDTQNSERMQDQLKEQMRDIEKQHGEAIEIMSIENAEAKCFSTMREDLHFAMDDIVLDSFDVNDCILRMYIHSMKSAEAFVEKSDVLTEIPVRILTEFQSSFEAPYTKAYENKRKLKLDELYKTAKAKVLEGKDDIILQAYDTNQCLTMMRTLCIKQVYDFMKADRFFKIPPSNAADDIHKALQDTFKRDFNKMSRLKEAELIRVVKEDVMQNSDNIVQQSISAEDCIERMYTCCSASAMRFIQKDEFLKCLPPRFKNLLKPLEKHFEKSYRGKEGDMEKKMIQTIKSDILRKQETIFADSLSLQHCLNLVTEVIEDTAFAFIQNKEFMMATPRDSIEALKNELLMEWKDLYKQRHSEKQSDLVLSVKAEVLKSRDDIVEDSENIIDCLRRMHKLVEKEAAAFVQNDDFLRTVPGNVLKSIVDGVEAEFRRAYKLKEKSLNKKKMMEGKIQSILSGMA